MYFVQIYIQCKLDPTFGPPGPKSSFREKVIAFKDIYAMLLLFLIVMVGMWFGIYTPNEAATMGAVGALICALMYRKLNRKNFYNALLDAIKTTGMIFIIFIGAKMFTLFITVSQLMQFTADWVVSLNMSPIVLVVFICIIYFFLGGPFDTITMIMLTLPILIPILNAAQVDLVWFGVLVVTQMELSTISPPVGLVLFSVAGMVKDQGITMNTVFWGALPYCVTMVVFNGILIAAPVLCLWLPSTMR
jgi:tripartite ATP-independent transporter DctM subunit